MTGFDVNNELSMDNPQNHKETKMITDVSESKYMSSNVGGLFYPKRFNSTKLSTGKLRHGFFMIQ